MNNERSRGGYGQNDQGPLGPKAGSMEDQIRKWRYVHQDNESLDCEIRARLMWVERWQGERGEKGMGTKELGAILGRRRWVAPEHARDMEWCRMKEGK